MATRTVTATPFKSGQSTNEHVEKSPRVPVKSDVSKTKATDALHASLGHRMPTLPSDHHIYTHTTTITPVGAHYSPAGEFGSVARTGAGQGVYSYGGAPNHKGSNALGKAMNKVGEKSGWKKSGKKAGGGGKHV